MVEPQRGYKTGIQQTVGGNIDGAGNWIEGASAAGFKPSSYDANLTMDATGEALALASGVKLGSGRVQVANLGATTEAIRVAFGTSEVNALANLTIAAGAATTGVYIGAAADLGSQSIQILGVPALATHIGVGPAVASDTQDVAVTQGI